MAAGDEKPPVRHLSALLWTTLNENVYEYTTDKRHVPMTIKHVLRRLLVGGLLLAFMSFLYRNVLNIIVNLFLHCYEVFSHGYPASRLHAHGDNGNYNITTSSSFIISFRIPRVVVSCVCAQSKKIVLRIDDVIQKRETDQQELPNMPGYFT
jgi:hypothetical protein